MIKKYRRTHIFIKKAKTRIYRFLTLNKRDYFGEEKKENKIFVFLDKILGKLYFNFKISKEKWKLKKFQREEDLEKRKIIYEVFRHAKKLMALE